MTFTVQSVIRVFDIHIFKSAAEPEAFRHLVNKSCSYIKLITVINSSGITTILISNILSLFFIFIFIFKIKQQALRSTPLNVCKEIIACYRYRIEICSVRKFILVKVTINYQTCKRTKCYPGIKAAFIVSLTSLTESE